MWAGFNDDGQDSKTASTCDSAHYTAWTVKYSG